MGVKESKILDKDSIIEFSFNIEPLITNDTNDELSINELPPDSIEKIKNYYDSKYFNIIFEKILKNNNFKYKIKSVTFNKDVLLFSGYISLKNRNDTNIYDISLKDIESYIVETIHDNKDNLLFKITENGCDYNIIYDKDYISDIDFEFKRMSNNYLNLEDNNNINIKKSKIVKIIKPRRQNEIYEKEKIINKNIKIKKSNK
jgi:hypothetical protein